MYRTRWMFLVLFVLSCSACSTHVPPWKRAALAQDNMALETDALEAALRQHSFFSKEASTGGYGGAGGGCGCN